MKGRINQQGVWRWSKLYSWIKHTEIGSWRNDQPERIRDVSEYGEKLKLNQAVMMNLLHLLRLCWLNIQRHWYKNKRKTHALTEFNTTIIFVFGLKMKAQGEIKLPTEALQTRFKEKVVLGWGNSPNHSVNTFPLK